MSKRMKLYYVVNARMPSHKAYGIQIAKMCEAFIEQGTEMELIIPRTHQSHASLKEFYNLRVDIPTRTFAAPDWYSSGGVGFTISSLLFMASACVYLLWHRNSATIYTIDMDSHSYAPLVFLGIPVAAEMHSTKTSDFLTRLFFKRIRHIITTNPLIKYDLISVFKLKSENFIVEPNGVDAHAFGMPSKEDSRRRLGLPLDAKIVLYIGRFYNWKGMHILQKASKDLAEKGINIYLVGGTKEEYETATNSPSASLYFGGSVAHKDIALWCAASDALLILGTRASKFSYRYTAPMKLYEYLASGRPTICADTLALRSLVSEEEVTFYIPDDPDDLARKISAVFSNPEKSRQLVISGLQKAREHTWAKRVERICAFLAMSNELRLCRHIWRYTVHNTV